MVSSHGGECSAHAAGSRPVIPTSFAAIVVKVCSHVVQVPCMIGPRRLYHSKISNFKRHGTEHQHSSRNEKCNLEN